MGVPFFPSLVCLSKSSTHIGTVVYSASHGIPATGTPSNILAIGIFAEHNYRERIDTRFCWINLWRQRTVAMVQDQTKYRFGFDERVPLNGVSMGNNIY